MTGLHAMTMHVYELDSRIKENLLKKMGSVLLNLFWIDYKITNPTELVSQILKLWTDRYEFSKIEFEFKPKRNRKGNFYSISANGRIHARGPGCAGVLSLLWPRNTTKPARREAWPSATRVHRPAHALRRSSARTAAIVARPAMSGGGPNNDKVFTEMALNHDAPT
jgi:hypothetical protein